MAYFKKVGWTRYDKWEKENKVHWTMSLPQFYADKDSLTVQITTFGDRDASNIRIFKNKKQVQLIKESYEIGVNFGMLEDTVFYGDINGDMLLDVKIVCWYGGNGTASLNERVIYLFQQPDNKFVKISFLDKMSSARIERDFDGDGNYEIITMSLEYYENHSYWTYNVYNFSGTDLVCVNKKCDYPIMIQFLYRRNFEITDKISRSKMKTFSVDKPEDYDRR